MNIEEAIEILLILQTKTLNPYDNIKLKKVIEWLMEIKQSRPEPTILTEVDT